MCCRCCRCCNNYGWNNTGYGYWGANCGCGNWNSQTRRAYRAGYRDGYQNGYRVGFEDGNHSNIPMPIGGSGPVNDNRSCGCN